MRYWKLRTFTVGATVLISGAAHADLGDFVTKLVDGATEMGNWYGVSVAISGNTVVVGDPRDNDNGNLTGSAFLYNAITGQELFHLFPSDPFLVDQFGVSVAISGNIAIVGADTIVGAIRPGNVYVFDVTTGQQLFKLIASDGANGDDFGVSIAIDGSTIVIGANMDDDAGNRSGSAYIFDAITGAQLFKLTANDAFTDDQFGFSVGISGTTAIIGAPKKGFNQFALSGAAYLFDTTTGLQTFKLLPGDVVGGDEFGQSVALSGDIAVVGCPLDEDNGADSGSAYFFDVTTGVQMFKVLPIGGGPADQFGSSVAISGGLAVIGEELNDANGNGAGAAYVFDSATGQELLQILASDGSAQDLFGVAVGVDEHTSIVVGAWLDDDACPLDINCNSGSAYLYDSDDPAFLVQPVSVVADAGAGPEDLVTVVDAIAPVQFQWRFDGTPLVDGGAYSGSNTGTLSITPSFDTVGTYDLVINDVTGMKTSDSAVFAVRNTNPLPADINGDGVVDTADLGILLGAFGSMAP